MWYKNVGTLFFVLSQSTCLTDGQTKFSLLDSVCILCSAVKTGKLITNTHKNNICSATFASIRFIKVIAYAQGHWWQEALATTRFLAFGI